MTQDGRTITAPLEPTDEMISAGYDATRDETGSPRFAYAGFTLGHAAEIYRAMVAALNQGGGA